MTQKPLFFVGLHQPANAGQFARCMVSVNRLEHRKSDFQVNDWIMDSGAFTRISTGRGHMPVKDYARQIERWSRCGNMMAAVTQDWMCEAFILGITGLTVEDHQRLTLERYAQLREAVGSTVYVMPVLQGYTPEEYVTHVRQYGAELGKGAWVGVGSVCKRNASPGSVERVLWAIHDERPDLRLHGFGLKRTALQSGVANSLLYSCDSMAWSYAARKAGRDANGPGEAHRYVEQIERMPVQAMLWSVQE